MKLVAIEDNCSGCRVCQVVCSLENFGEVNPSKAALGIKGLFPAPGKYEIELCDQCGKCAEACPTDAIYLEDGVYLINDEECIGCMSCVEACPKGVMYEHKSSEVPIKCTLCGECVKACPRDALILTD